MGDIEITFTKASHRRMFISIDDNPTVTISKSAKCSAVCRNNSIYASMSFGNQRNRNSSAEKLRFPTGSWVFSRAFQLAFRYRWLDEFRGGTKETDGEATRSRSFLCDRFYLHLTNALLQAPVESGNTRNYHVLRIWIQILYLFRWNGSKSQIACSLQAQLLLFA